jgi:uncharacterized membrane protein
MNTFNHKIRRKRLSNRLLNYFFKGMLISIPLAATYFMIAWIFQAVDNVFGKDHLPGIGILLIVSVILVVGWIGSSYLVQPFINWFDDWMEKTPGVKFLYSSVKDIMEAFVGEKKKFSEPVVVEVGGEGIYKIGFITRKDMAKIGMPDYCGVYFPKSYGFVGDLLLVRLDKVKPIQANSTEVFKMIVSGGVTGIGDQAD